MRILLIEDDSMYADMIKFYLDKTNCEVVWAENWEQAATLIQAGNYEAVITDNDFPGGSCVKTVEHVRALNAATPIFLLSGRSDQVGDDFLAAGGTKAFHKMEIKDAIKEVMAVAA